MNPPITPMSLGDIFDALFKLLGRTALRNLILSAIILLPAALISIYGLEALFSSLAEFLRDRAAGRAAATAEMARLFGVLGTYLLVILLLLMAYLAAALGATIVACSEISGQAITWQEALRRVFSVRLARTWGQSFLAFLALVGIILAAYLVLIAAVVADSSAMEGIGVIALLLGICAAVYFWVRWIFALPAIAWEGAGVMESFRRSSFLVNGWWWRTFGIGLLLYLITQFAITLVTTPLSFVALWGFFKNYFALLGSASGGQPDPDIVYRLFDSLGVGLGILIYISYILTAMIVPLFVAIMYFDLRARKGEFAQSLPPQPLMNGESGSSNGNP